MISLPMHWAKAVFPLFKEPGGAAALLTLISRSSRTPVAYQWQLGPRRRVNADKKVNLLCHPWVSHAKKWFADVCPGRIQSLHSVSRELLITGYGALPGSLSEPPASEKVDILATWWLSCDAVWEILSTFHLLLQDARIVGTGTTASFWLPACSGKTVRVIHFPSLQVASFSRVLWPPPFLPEDHRLFGSSVLNCWIYVYGNT